MRRDAQGAAGWAATGWVERSGTRIKEGRGPGAERTGAEGWRPRLEETELVREGDAGQAGRDEGSLSAVGWEDE